MSSHDDDTSQSQHIPLDLTIEIFSKLPARSIGRFRSVSNLWSTITTSQYFINSFTMRSLAARPSVLIFVYQGDKLFVFSSTLNKNSSGCPLSCVGSYQFPNPDLGSLERYHSLQWSQNLAKSYASVVINSIRKVLCERTLGEELRCGNGLKLDKGCRYTMMSIYPNHIESLVSFVR
ncbi:putative F-box protein At1g59675 [Capsella rubella]|uniref:putative F-box protein At1g59675 n=1 Tax=Capsella rubella TaxID=81985 RepID=UPI000CD537CD|nr:putative F-box protein At1g59675 [Capsella rubella]